MSAWANWISEIERFMLSILRHFASKSIGISNLYYGRSWLKTRKTTEESKM